MMPFIFNSADTYEEEEEEEEELAAVAAAAAAAVFFNMCIVVTCVVFVSIQQRLRGSQEDCGRRGEDDSGEEDDSMSTTEASTSDDGMSLDDDDDDDDEPPPGDKRAAPVTTKKTTQPIEMSESSSDVEIANDPLPLLKNALTPAVKSDSGNDLIRAAPAKGRSKAVLAGKRKSLDDEDEDGDAYIRPVKKTKTTAQTRMTESFEKSPARAKLASKTTTVRKPSGSTNPPPKKVHAKANEASD
ncbi:hypothetical protein EDB83DRAFT_2380249, partial [Lactarius deliciosus]